MALPRKRKWAKMGVREAYQIRCPAHLAFIRRHACCTPTDACHGKTEAAHVRILIGPDVSRGGVGLKPGDEWTLSLCSYHHAQQHQVGEREFERIHKINMQQLAAEFWAKSPHGRAYRMKMERA